MNDYDILLLTETWNSNLSNTKIDGYESFNCSRPKSNKKAKRDSGGVIVYYKQRYRNYLQLISINTNGLVWFKLKKEIGNFENDLILCLCYIPPEGSSVYRNENSDLYDYDFFESLNNDIIRYSELGTIYLAGDFNSRTGSELDFVPDIGLDRFVDVPLNEDSSSLSKRKNFDTVVNSFGLKLLTLCKENNLFPRNGQNYLSWNV